MADEKKSEDMSEDELDQIIADMSKEEEEAPAEVAPVVALKPTAAPSPAKAAAKPVALVNPAPAATVGAAPDQSLSLELTGVVNLKLNFASGDRSIELTCSEEGLLCRMADGTEFRIPVGVAKKRNAA